MLLGAHVSAAGGLDAAMERAVAMGAEVVQCFPTSPRTWRRSVESASEVGRLESKHDLPLFFHAPYLVNLCSLDGELWKRSIESLRWHLEVGELSGAAGVVLHPGSHKGAGIDTGMKMLVRGLAEALSTTQACPLLLENTAGGGNTIGRTLHELSEIINLCGLDAELGARTGLCLDTQHLWASGTDFSSEEQVEDLICKIEATIGLERLGLLHINDSKVAIGSNSDRHENLGEGTIGLDRLALFLGHAKLDRVPGVLEVPGPNRKGPTESDLSKAREIVARGQKVWGSRST